MKRNITDAWFLGQAIGAIIVIPLMLLAFCSVSRGDGGAPPPPPVVGPPCPPPPVKGLVLTPRGFTATPYVYSPGGLPRVIRGRDGEVGYEGPPLQRVQPGPCGFPSAFTGYPAPDFIPRWSYAPFVPPPPGFFFY
jgi:hypothetical protein